MIDSCTFYQPHLYKCVVRAVWDIRDLLLEFKFGKILASSPVPLELLSTLSERILADSIVFKQTNLFIRDYFQANLNVGFLILKVKYKKKNTKLDTKC